MIPPELIDWLNDWPFGLLAFFLTAPFLVLIGAILSYTSSRKGQKGTQRVGEKEASTHEFSAILDGLNDILDRQKQQLDELRGRVDMLETHERDLMDHVYMLENLVPSPPGPPDRPGWMRPRMVT